MEEQRIYTDLYEAFDDTYVIDKIYDALLKEDGLSDEEKAAITQRNNYERDCVIIDNGNIILIACNEFGDELDYDDDHFTCFIQPSEKKVILTNRPKRNNKEVSP